MKPYLTSDKITQLNGRSIRLFSPSDGRLLTISPRGKITSELPETGFDQYWNLIPVDDGFLLASSKNGDMICHHLIDGGMIISKPLSDDINDCVWKLGKQGEIYQPNPKGGERYLWLANDKLYATLDGFLAENWVPLNDDENPLPLPSLLSPSSAEGYFSPFITTMFITAMIILVVGIWLSMG